MKNNNGFGKKAENKQESFHVIHKLPPGDSPYVRAKYFQVCFFRVEFCAVLFVINDKKGVIFPTHVL